MHLAGGHHVAPDGLDQGAEQDVALPDPIGQEGAFQGESATGEDGALPIERQMITELARQHVGQECRPGEAPGDGPAGHLGLGDVIAAGAGELGAHMADHLEAGGDVLEHLRDLFAQGLEGATAAGATGVGRQVFDGFPGQIVGKGFALAAG